MKQRKTKKEVAEKVTRRLLADDTNATASSSNNRYGWFITSCCFAGIVIACVAIWSGALDQKYNLIDSSVSEAREGYTEMRNLERGYEITPNVSNESSFDTEAPTEAPAVEAVASISGDSPDIDWVWYAPEWYDSTRMSYMDYRTITCEGTLQWELQNDGWTSTDPSTGIRMRGGRYMIALGQTFGLTGTKVDVHLQNGVTIPCILGDSKEWCDTLDGEGVIGADTGTVEFIVEEELLPDDVIELGSNELQFNGYWQSPVSYIEVLAD